jgi:hypothetical protein
LACPLSSNLIFTSLLLFPLSLLHMNTRLHCGNIVMSLVPQSFLITTASFLESVVNIFLLQNKRKEYFWSQLRSRAMVYRLFSKSPPFGTSTKLFNLFNAGMRSIICIILDCNYNIGFM